MKTNGKIAIWRYRQALSNYAGFHATADADGAAFIAGVIGSLSTGSEGRITLVSITPRILSVPNNPRDQAVGYGTFVVRAREGRNLQTFFDAHPVLTLAASPDSLAALAAGFREVATGAGDFTIGPDEHNLWFWWWPNRG